MATNKSASKKANQKKNTTEKTAKKSSAKKPASKENTSENINAEEPSLKESPPEKEILTQDTEAVIPIFKDCMCMQKRPNGKFYSYKLIQGRWVQSSGIPFPTKEICEDACC